MDRDRPLAKNVRLRVHDSLYVLDLPIRLQGAGYVPKNVGGGVLDVETDDERALRVLLANWEALHGVRVEIN
jgi:hypothetical protein